MPQHHPFHPRAREDLIVFADENLIAQVVTNLLKNAIQAIGNAPDGKITLKAYCDPQESIRIEIANNGPAIPPDAAGQIFCTFLHDQRGRKRHRTEPEQTNHETERWHTDPAALQGKGTGHCFCAGF